MSGLCFPNHPFSIVLRQIRLAFQQPSVRWPTQGPLLRKTPKGGQAEFVVALDSSVTRAYMPAYARSKCTFWPTVHENARAWQRLRGH